MINRTGNNRHKVIGLAMFVGFLLILGLPFYAYAAPVGKVTALEGNVDVTPPDGKAQPLKLNDPVNLGDILRTKSRSKVEVTFTDGNVLRLAESTRLKVTQYAPGENQKSYLNLFRGKTQSIVNALGKGSQYEIHTPTAICGVRGTNFFSFFINGVSGAVFKEGSGYGYNPNMPQDVKPIAAGQSMLVTNASLPPVVKPTTAIEMEKLLKDTAPPEDKGKKDEGAPKDTAPTPSPPAPPPTQEPPPPALPPAGNIPNSLNPPTVLIPLPTPTPEPTPTPTPEPTSTPPAQTSFSTPISGLGWITGTLGATIDDVSNTGTITLTGTGTPTTGAGTISGTMSDGSAYNAYLAGVPGSWRGLLAGIYKKGSNEIGLLEATLSGTLTGSNLSADGSISRGAVLGKTTDTVMSPFNFPVYEFKTIDATGSGLYVYGDPRTDVVQGYNYTTTGGILGIWGIATTGGTYRNTSHASLSADQWSTYTWGSRIMHSLGMNLTDDGLGHTELTGLMNYMDTRYRGTVSLHHLGTYSNIDPLTNIYSSYETVGAGAYRLNRLTFTGDVGSNNIGDKYVFANNSGTWAEAGNISILLGAETIPWSSASTTLYHGGVTSIDTAYSEYSHFLWNAPVIGYDVDKGTFIAAYNNGLGGGYINGFSGGILTGTGGTMSGTLAALYLSTDRGQAGYLTGPIASLDPGLWMDQGTLTRTVPAAQFGTILTTDVVTVELGSLTGTLTGSVGDTGTLTGDVPESGGMIAYFAKNETSYLPWGIYSLKFGGTFSNPENANSWTATAGGAGSGFGGYGGYGGYGGNAYWIGTINDGTWSSTGELNGNFSGTFLTGRMMGTWQGPFYGIDPPESTWIGQSVGVYEGTPLKFVSKFYAGTNTLFYPSDDGGSKLENGSLGGGTSGNPGGLMGGTESPWTAGQAVNVTLMGVPAITTPDQANTLWSHISSYNYITGAYTTYDGGAYQGYADAIVEEMPNGIKGKILALYIDPWRKAGYLKGNYAGSVYPAISMWEASGSITPTKKVDDIGFSAADMYNSISSGSLNLKIAGSFVGNSESFLSILPANTYGCTESIRNNTTHVAQPWGIFHYAFTGGYYNPSATWAATAGGSATLGSYWNGSTWVSDSGGYWIVNIDNADWDNAVWLGGGSERTGKFLTPRKMGDITADLYGKYNDPVEGSGTWLGFISGVWDGAPLSHVSSIDTVIGMSYYDGVDKIFKNEGSLGGLIGGTASLWTASKGSPVSLTAMGPYTAGTFSQHVWATNIISRDYVNATDTTYDGGAYRGLMMGTHDNGSLEGKMAACYIDPSGNAGYVIGSMTGEADSAIGMYKMEGNAYTIQMATADQVNILPSNLAANFYASPATDMYLLDGSFTGGTVAFCPGGVCVGAVRSAMITNQNWGIWRHKTGGTITDMPSDTWSSSVDWANASPISTATSLGGGDTIGSKWSDNKIVGTAIGYSASVGATPSTWVSVGEIIGTYNPTALTFQMVNTGVAIETGKFLQMQGGATTDAAANATLKALNIPAVQVGSVNLTGSGSYTSSANPGTMNVTMNDVRFFASAAGGPARIWAANQSQMGNWSHSYGDSPPAGTAATISGGALSANFTVRTFDTASGKWLATVTDGSGGFNGSTTFRGAAAGTINTGAKTFSGTAAGVAK